MKTINLKLENNEIKIIDTDTIYLEQDEQVKFKITNQLAKNDRLYFSINDKPVEIVNREFVLSYEDIKKQMNLTITMKSDNSIYPTLFILKELKMNDIKVIGDTIDEKYPEIIKKLYDEILLLKKGYLYLYDDLKKHKEKEGVIE